jgi:hypothetical protein
MLKFSLELSAEAYLLVGLTGTSAVTRKGIIGTLFPYPDEWICHRQINEGGTARSLTPRPWLVITTNQRRGVFILRSHVIKRIWGAPATTQMTF